MGLRIIDRIRSLNTPINSMSPLSFDEGERSALLEEEARRWSFKQGGDLDEKLREFRDKFRIVKSRQLSTSSVEAMAHMIEKHIKSDGAHSTDVVGPIDIATLLELL